MNGNLLKDKIKNILITNRIPHTPENITNACFETIHSLLEQKQNEESINNVISLSNIILKMGSFKLTPINLKSISNILKFKPSLGCNVLKNYLKNRDCSNVIYSDNSLDSQLFKILLNFSSNSSVSNLLTKFYDVGTFFNACDIDQKINLLVNNMSACAPHCNVFEFLRSYKSPLNQVALSYLQYRNNSPLNSEEIIEITKYIALDSALNYQIIITLLQFNRTNELKAKMNGPSNKIQRTNIFTPRFIELIRREIFEVKHDDQSLTELFSLASDNLLPHFISIIKEMNEKFITEEKFAKPLKILISYLKIEDFAEIVGELDISKHYVILKGLSNIDLSVFIEIYNVARLGTNFESIPLDVSRSSGFICKASEPGLKALDHTLSILPSFSYYCTDYFNNIDNIVKILKAHFLTHRSIICNAIEKIIHSHQCNLLEFTTMNNPIPKEDSEAILLALKNSNIVYDILNSYIQYNDDNAETALELMIKLTNVDFGLKLISVINENSFEMPIYTALKLLSFFINKVNFNFDLVNRIVELASGNRIDVQKKAYDLLSSIYEHSATHVCICDLLFSSMAKSIQIPALKNRLNLQYIILKKSCHVCKSEDKNENFVKFINEVVRNLRTSNAKCKKFIHEIILKLADDEFFINYIVSQMTKKNPDCSMIIGSVECALYLLEYIKNNPFYLETHTLDTEVLLDKIFSGIEDIYLYSYEIVKPILKILNYFLNEKFYNQIVRITDSYIHQFSKKCNHELKELCIKAQKNGFLLSKTMKTLLKFRNKSGKPNNVTVLEKKDFNKLI